MRWIPRTREVIRENVAITLNGCWLWTGPLAGGYPLLGGRDYAHRVAYTLWVGPIPEGLTLDHLCRTPACVNPKHLEPVTLRENILRGTSPAARNAAVTRCPAGHQYDQSNTHITKSGSRHCRTCHRERERERSQRLREARRAMDA